MLTAWSAPSSSNEYKRFIFSSLWRPRRMRCSKGKLPPLGHTDPGQCECRNPSASLSRESGCFIVENNGVICRKWRRDPEVSGRFHLQQTGVGKTLPRCTKRFPTTALREFGRKSRNNRVGWVWCATSRWLLSVTTQKLDHVWETSPTRPVPK